MQEASLAVRLEKRLRGLIAPLLLLFIILTCLRPAVTDMDFGWQVAQGRWMIQHGAFYRHDAFNYPQLGQPVVDEYPLFQVVAYWAHSLGALGPSLLCTVGYSALFILILAGGWEFNPRPRFLFLAAVGMSLLFMQMSLRPHLVTYLCLAAFAMFLLRHRQARSVLEFWPLAVTEVAWVNCHSGFIIGPLLVGLFGGEMILREGWKTRRFPWQTCCVWLGAFCFISLACFINPSGADRLTLPFFQETSGVIRAYVGEMQPLNPAAQALFNDQALVAALLIFFVVLWQKGRVSWSWLLLTIFFYVESLSASKHWALFGLMLPILVLSGAAFSANSRDKAHPHLIVSMLTETVVLIFLAMGLMLRLGPDSGLVAAWRDFDRHRTDMPQSATDWMKAHGVDGRLFHRGEDGGWLQAEGFDRGQTFCDAGLGKFSNGFIREIGLLGARPGFLTHELVQHQPAFVVCGSLAYAWPSLLRAAGWRPVFYSENSSVWTRSGVRTDLPTVTLEEIAEEFRRAQKANGVPHDPIWYARVVLALHAAGGRNLAATSWQALPANQHRTGYYWDCARQMCFDAVTLDLPSARLFQVEISHLPNPALADEFQAYALHAEGKPEDALALLEKNSRGRMSDPSAFLLLKLLYEAQRWDDAVALVKRADCFDPNDGERQRYRALLAEHFGRNAEAATAWQQALFFAPDSAEVQGGAEAFARRTGDAELEREVDRTR